MAQLEKPCRSINHILVAELNGLERHLHGLRTVEIGYRRDRQSAERRRQEAEDKRESSMWTSDDAAYAYGRWYALHECILTVERRVNKIHLHMKQCRKDPR